ncbi:MAG: transcriptional regulator [bacterium]|nr:transcriptional regulator [bacterium]
MARAESQHLSGDTVPRINNEGLARYIPIAKMIAKMFGKNCEVVLHDLSIPQNSVVFAVNNHVTGRQIGQPFDHLVKQVLLSKDFSGDYAANYLSTSVQGRNIKSSTALIRDSEGSVIGALCINYDVEAIEHAKSILDEFLDIQIEETQSDFEPFENVIDIVDDLITKIIGNAGDLKLKKQDRIALIRFMDQKGIFQIKGSIEKVARQLNISTVTVYSYLDEIRKN